MGRILLFGGVSLDNSWVDFDGRRAPIRVICMYDMFDKLTYI